ncbi:hypothetical protein [Novilysobacter defluvii]|uniref:Uncharacterized protein n=1 Tax=Lysobacter defluvii IMMIB APB-9 = DSM 18482 TaxID=1385515 RepID=A0A0A0MBW5_9GAMM|nr:hypothetical protein [Lysobacter defluvii]KGO99281.1 hypothetical protein N791_10350 [Lysobacter defluvii IMMIB APB-9 = DSM 18482]
MDRTRFRFPRSLPFLLAMLLLASGAALARAPEVQAVRDALRNGEPGTAVELGEKAIAAQPRDADAWYYAGQAYGWMAMEANLLRKPHWAGKAHEAFRKAATLDPDHLGAREGLVQFYAVAPAILGGGRDKAEAEIEAYASRDRAGGHYLRGMLLKEAAAERELREAVRLAPANPKFRMALIARLIANGTRAAELLPEIDAALLAAPDDARLLYQLGRFAAVHGQRTQDGEAALGRVLDGTAQAVEEASRGGAHWRRGQLREKRGDIAGALADYRAAVRLEPDQKPFRKDLERLERDG